MQNPNISQPFSAYRGGQYWARMALAAVFFLELIGSYAGVRGAVIWSGLLATSFGWHWMSSGNMAPNTWKEWWKNETEWQANGIYHALLWGAGACLFFPTGSFPTQALVAFILCGIALGGSVAYRAHDFVASLFAAIVLVPYSLRLIFEPGRNSLELTLILFAAIAVSFRGKSDFGEKPSATTGTNDFLTELAKLKSELARVNEAFLDSELALESARHGQAEFVGTVAHEIRTPLNGILGLSDVLARTALPPSAEEIARTLHISAESLFALVNDLLDFSKLESGQLKLDTQTFNLRRILDTVAEILRPRAIEKGVAFSIRTSPEIPKLLNGDDVRVQQVLMNLTANAINFTDTGSVEIEARIGETMGSEYQIEICVKDTGLGIPSDRIKDLFKKFSQVRNEKTGNRGGTGLGLYISQQIAALLGGQITVQSAEGRGSEFLFSFRASQVSESANTDLRKEIGSLSAESGLGNEVIRILIVDDNSANRLVALQFLKQLGFKADVVEDGQKAVEVLRQKIYDLVFMDMLMPHLDGLEATRKIRSELPADQQPYIVGLSANTKKSEHERCLAAGMNSFYTKPIRLEMLTRAIAGFRNRDLRPAKWEEDHILSSELPAPNRDLRVVEGGGKPSSNSQASLDETELIRLRGMSEPGEADFLDQIINEFATVSRETLLEIRKEWERRNLEQVHRLVHKFQGTARGMGALRLVQLAAEIEVAAEGGHAESISLSLQKLEEEYNKVCRILVQNWKLSA